jgi:hypothetical protein
MIIVPSCKIRPLYKTPDGGTILDKRKPLHTIAIGGIQGGNTHRALTKHLNQYFSTSSHALYLCNIKIKIKEKSYNIRENYSTSVVDSYVILNFSLVDKNLGTTLYEDSIRVDYSSNALSVHYFSDMNSDKAKTQALYAAADQMVSLLLLQIQELDE